MSGRLPGAGSTAETNPAQPPDSSQCQLVEETDDTKKKHNQPNNITSKGGKCCEEKYGRIRG